VGTTAGCNPTNCDGCCDTGGVCQNPADIGACGSAGVACVFCPPGEACVGDTCVAASECSATCVGCCQNGICLAGVDKMACGSSGAACQTCDPSSWCVPLGLKNGGECGNINKGCSPGQCPGGCCDQSGICHTYSSSYCGISTVPDGGGSPRGENGENCSVCSGACIDGRCDGPECNYLTCFGCCLPDGTCWTGQIDDQHCGAPETGELCIDCGPGYQCGGNFPYQTCQIACGPQNCQGCCDGPVCTTGLAVSDCGSHGGQCAQCAGNELCVGGSCLVATQCGPTLCTGCCENDVCAIGNADDMCGAGGGACQNCTTSGEKCSSAGACAP
jgi:hypothetical protein